ncbi:Barstar [Tolypothrix sp. NIES-4075]|uniref:barstar family protein n=1 Tax=Tolypothrix sp. NIES-4075 TaxID=2005459 RepID=UPI000B5CC4A1|nr:barstar family protein [Tolypothrix sp. NIES-4075]GAX45868.1 Barstar [Tolypothrix sp. NIES-4075]
MKVEIKGNKIFTINDFHRQIAKLLDLEPYYGNNFNALWDSLTTDVERPVSLIWLDSAI